MLYHRWMVAPRAMPEKPVPIQANWVKGTSVSLSEDIVICYGGGNMSREPRGENLEHSEQ